MTVGGAVISGPKMGLIGLACLCSTLVSIDGSLLQKGTTIDLDPIVAPPITLNVSLAQEIPHLMTGGWWKLSNSSSELRFSLSFNQSTLTVNSSTPNLIGVASHMPGSAGVEWFGDKSIPGIVHGCPRDQTCRAKVRAPALAVTECISRSINVNYWEPIKTPKNVFQVTGVAPPLTTLDFIIDTSLILNDTERINVITGYGTNRNCTGMFQYRICTLESAIGEHNILVTNDKATLTDELPQIVALANNTKVSSDWSSVNEWYPSTLAGIVALAGQKWQSAANYAFSQTSPYQSGYNPNIYRTYASFYQGFMDNVCWTYVDPHTDVLQDLNRLMFMLGAEIGVGEHGSAAHIQSLSDPNLPIRTTTEGYLHGTHNVFETNLRWFAAAALVELVCIGLILPTYIGWWRLGRSVSFSPLEIAKAFEAPLLSDCNSNSSGSEIAKDVGGFRVRYGEVKIDVQGPNECSVPSKLAFANPTMVNDPRRLETFDA